MDIKRIYEIDFLRSTAVILMIVFHTIYDLNEYLGMNIIYRDLPWSFIGKLSALLFIYVSGVSCGFSRRPLKRGLELLILGMGISIVTYFFIGEQYIRFGILHFLGISMILYLFLNKFSNLLLLIISGASFFIGFSAVNITTNLHCLLPLGVTYPGFVTIDYYPVFPYIGVFIIGILSYKKIYYKGEGLFKFELATTVIQYISKNSLHIYILHQPVIILLMMFYRFSITYLL